jgi:hypothetical protein
MPSIKKFSEALYHSIWSICIGRDLSTVKIPLLISIFFDLEHRYMDIIIEPKSIGNSIIKPSHS